MPVLNIDNYPFLWTWGRPQFDYNDPNDTRQNHIHWKAGLTEAWFNELHSRHEDMWLIQFMLDDAFRVYTLEELMPAELLERLKKGDLKLVLENSAHGYNQNVGAVYKDIVLKYNINPQNILYRSESADLHEEVQLISVHLGLPELKTEWIREFEQQFSCQARETTPPKTLELKSYGQKRFLSYNGLYRPHRGAVVSLLYCYNVLDHGHVSYCIKDNFTVHETNEHVNWYKSQFSNYPGMSQMFEHNRQGLVNLTKLTLDNDWTTKNTAGHYETDNHYYENTYFSLVTETSFPFKPFSIHYPKRTDTGRILSEKIFKPILNWHPFIVASNYQTLALLKSLGYRSFSPYIDESYDEIEDDKLRLITIAKEVKRLCHLSRMELDEFLIGCRKICEFNWNHLRNTRNYITRLN